MDIVIVPNENGLPAGKLADAEIHFTDGPLAGLKHAGFAIWESQWPGKGRHQWLRVTVPAREYERDGERRRWDLVRPLSGDPATLEPLRAAILEAYTADARPPVAAPPVTGAEALARQTWRNAQAATPSAPRRAPFAPRPAPAHATAPVRRPAPPRPTDDYPF
jgi:hypothetical protein